MERTHAFVLGVLLATPTAVTPAQEVLDAIPITASSANNSGGPGWTMFFDLTVTSLARLDGLQIHDAGPAGGTGNVDVYLTPGSHIGAPPGGWLLVGSSDVGTSAGQGSPTHLCFSAPVALAPGNYGIGLTHNGFAPAYTNGTGPSPGGNQGPYVSIPTGYASLTAGTALSGRPGSPGSVFSPRVWNGQLQFDLACTRPVVASARPIGSGCGASGTGAIYERFAAGSTFDFASGTGFRLLLSSGQYAAAPAANPIVSPSSIPLAFSSDPERVALPSPLPSRTGPKTDLFVCSNGFVSLEPTTNADFTPTVAELLSDEERVFALWADLNPFAGGSVHAETDAGNPRLFHVTYLNVPVFGGLRTSTFQITFDTFNGEIEVKYGAVAAVAGIIGYSQGGGIRDPGATDMNSPTLAASTTPLRGNLTLVSDRPVTGRVVRFTTTEIPASSLAGTVLLGLSAFPSPIDLDPVFGTVGCSLVGPGDLGAIRFGIAGGIRLHSIDLSRVGPSQLGTMVFLQSAVVAPGANPFGVVTSNGIEWVVGSI